MTRPPLLCQEHIHEVSGTVLLEIRLVLSDLIAEIVSHCIDDSESPVVPSQRGEEEPNRGYHQSRQEDLRGEDVHQVLESLLGIHISPLISGS